MKNNLVSLSLAETLEEFLSEPFESATKRAATTFDVEMGGLKNRIVLFGAGNMGRRVLARLKEDGIKPLAFCDNEKRNWGTTIEGVPVLAPMVAATEYGRNAAVVVTIYNRDHSFSLTQRQLKDIGFTKVISVLSLRWKYHETFLPYYRDDLPQNVLHQRDAIRQAFAIWADAVSKAEFVSQVGWRLNGDFDLLSSPLLGQQYFPKGLFNLSSDEFFVDAGAYDGDTLREFLMVQENRFRGILALEPHPENFSKLSHFVENCPPPVKCKIQTRPQAVGSQNCLLRFSGNGGTSSAISDDGAVEVDCIKLDDLLHGLRPTYVKMDIEGAELDAIRGCARVLREDRPVLAACVYHEQDHLWKIPLLLEKMTTGYRFFLRAHMQECWETVCYAVPEERLGSS